MHQNIKNRCKKLQQQFDALQKNIDKLDHPTEANRLLHTSQVYQIELEMQNQDGKTAFFAETYSSELMYFSA